MNGTPVLSFQENQTFRVLHLTDLQEGIHPKKDTLLLLHALLDAAKPDLVILTGDQIKGYSPAFRITGKSGFQKSIRALTSPMEEHGIPYAVTFGNHDIQCGISNEEQAAFYRTLPHCICPADGPSAGTFALSVTQNGKEALRFYLLDSGNTVLHGSYDPPAREGLLWLKSMLDSSIPSGALPSVVFQHIPLPEYQKCTGVVPNEPICSPTVNAGEFDLLHANGHVLAVFCGHDHKNDFLGHYHGIDLGYTPSCGFACYGPGAGRGGRLLLFHADAPGTYETKLLRYCDLIAPHTKNRLKEYWDTHIPTCWPGRESEKQ